MNSLRIHTFLVFSLFAINVAASQSLSTRIWVFFRDRGQVTIDFTAPAAARDLGISERALWRRSKVLPANRLLDERDLPVSPEYLDELSRAGLTVKSVSRWLNAASVEISSEQRNIVSRLPFVSHSLPAARLRTPPVEAPPLAPRSSVQKSTLTLLDYGPSLLQLSNMRVVDVHNLGIYGRGVVVGMIDDGFNRHRTHEALSGVTVLSEYDYINRDSVTSSQPGETDGGGSHGAATMSALAGYAPGELIGAAFRASLVLAKTEIGNFEQPVEEDLYVEALESMERTGVDIVSTSLGYDDFDPRGQPNAGDHFYSNKDGNTAPTSRAARVAASKGVLLVTAMGNEGWYQKDSTWKSIPGVTGSLICPADADSIMAVGATFSDGFLASFSSTGPTFDSRVKPEVVAQGVSVRSVNSSSDQAYTYLSGTSLSTPLTAGAAALILSAHPDLTPMQVREAFIQTAVHINDPPLTPSYPNNYYGYGFVNALAAVTYHGVAFSNQPMVVENSISLGVYVWAVSSSSLVGDSLLLHYQAFSGSPFLQVRAAATGTQNLYVAVVPAGSDSSFPRGYFSARDNAGRSRRFPYNAPDSLLVFRQYIVTEIPGGAIPDEFVLNVNYPNPFNAGTTMTFDAPASEYVELQVYDLLGRRVKTVFRGNSIRGRNVYSWNGTDESGKSVSTGVYFSHLKTSRRTLTQKMLFLK